MSNDTKHTYVKSWYKREFPFETDEDTIGLLHEVLPTGYWIARDYSSDEKLFVLMRNEDHFED